MYDSCKRVIDLVFSVIVLICTAPVCCVVALWIKVDSRGPVFYTARRIGRCGKSFKMYKFRSMVAGADKAGPSSASDGDIRITRPGRLVRKFKIDEVPQFFNVLRGDMSVIGPRPEVQFVVDRYTDLQRGVLEVLPGVVDYGTLWNRDEGLILRGSQDPDRDYIEKILPIKVSLSLEYVRTRSLITDGKIAVAAFLAAFLRRDPRWALPIDRMYIPPYTRESVIEDQ